MDPETVKNGYFRKNGHSVLDSPHAELPKGVNRLKDRQSTRVQLLAESSYVHFDEMVTAMTLIVLASPTLFEQRTFGNDLPRTLHQRNQQSEFDRCQQKLDFAAPRLMSTNINDQVPGSEFRHCDCKPSPYTHL